MLLLWVCNVSVKATSQWSDTSDAGVPAYAKLGLEVTCATARKPPACSMAQMRLCSSAACSSALEGMANALAGAPPSASSRACCWMKACMRSNPMLQQHYDPSAGRSA